MVGEILFRFVYVPGHTCTTTETLFLFLFLQTLNRC